MDYRNEDRCFSRGRNSSTANDEIPQVEQIRSTVNNELHAMERRTISERYLCEEPAVQISSQKASTCSVHSGSSKDGKVAH